MIKKIILCLFVIGSSLKACDRSLEELKEHLLRFDYISMEYMGKSQDIKARAYSRSVLVWIEHARNTHPEYFEKSSSFGKWLDLMEITSQRRIELLNSLIK